MDVEPAVSTRWTPPTADEAAMYVHGGEVDFWVVVRDDRGGVGWRSGRATLKN
jgi:predicted nucleotidyltransferase